MFYVRLLLLSLVQGCTPAWATVTDRILFVVGERLVTVSDREFERELARVDPGMPPPFSDPGYDLEQRLVDMAILRALAGDSAVYQPRPADLRARWERVRDAWPGLDEYNAFLNRWGVDDERLQAMLYSRMVVEKYVYRNVGLAVGAAGGGDEDYRAAYQAWMGDQRSRTLVRVAP